MFMNNHCTVCLRECEKGKSFCHRRDNKGNLKQKYRFCAITSDYLYDKPVVHFRENCKVLSLGSWGCNLRCLGCQNVNLSWSLTGKKLEFTKLTPGKAIDQALENGCRGICYTYNEPAILIETVADIAEKAREKGLFNVLVTNSTLTESSVRYIAGNIDAVAADIKSFTDRFYYEYCGATGIPGIAGKILKCIKTFSECGCHVEIRTNIIPGGNDQVENYRNIASWIMDNLGQETPWHITRFFPAHQLSHVAATSEETMIKARNIGLGEGLKNVHVYTEKGCDCAGEKDLVKKTESDAIHDCCKERSARG